MCSSGVARKAVESLGADPILAPIVQKETSARGNGVPCLICGDILERLFLPWPSYLSGRIRTCDPCLKRKRSYKNKGLARTATNYYQSLQMPLPSRLSASSVAIRSKSSGLLTYTKSYTVAIRPRASLPSAYRSDFLPPLFTSANVLQSLGPHVSAPFCR